MKWIKKISILLIVATLGGCAKNEFGLTPEKPVTITVWHYYNSAQKNAFDKMIDEFNESVGVEKGIIVEAYSQGSVNELEASVAASMNHAVGSQPLPDIFQTYADTAFAAEEKGLLADLNVYFTKQEQEKYVDAYLEEGRIGKDSALKIFPTAKSTEIMMLNKTDWDRFAAQTGAQLSELSTKEGVVRTAENYYKWTDAMTPSIPDDGKAFYGRDALANLFVIGAKQLDCELFQVKDGKVKLNLDKEVLRKIWDVYYVPGIHGYFGAYGRFRSDDAKVGKIIALTGSSSSAAYFPTTVTNDAEESYEIETIVLPTPVFEGGKSVAVQQGAGMAVVKSTPLQEYASVVFLKWITQAERNLEFSYMSGYMPVLEKANDFNLLSDIIKDSPYPSAHNDALKVSMETVKSYEMYTNKAFKNGADARKLLETHLYNKLEEDLKVIENNVVAGISRQAAAEKFDTEQNFEEWYTAFCQVMEDTVQG